MPEPATRNLNEQPPVVNNLLLYWIHHGRITVVPGVERFEGRVVHFMDGTSREFDTVLWATGFRVQLPFLDDTLLTWRDGAPLRTAGLTLPVGPENLYFIGLAAPRGPQAARVLGAGQARRPHASSSRSGRARTIGAVRGRRDR